MNKNLRIIFMGTPQFAVPSLEILLKNNYNIVAVITAPDKPAGRGKKITESEIKKFALEKGLNILQPTNLKDESFIGELKALNADLQIVVAFRMLPEIVWNMPPMGTFNLHASLLPQYRGAAPINWAIINGEKETGVTTFFLKHEIDTGSIITNKKANIEAEATFGDLHDTLKNVGAELVLESVELIRDDKFIPTPQSEILKDETTIKDAPKIYKEDSKIDWSKNVEQVHNLIRGLCPYPGAYSELISPEGDKYIFKVFKSTIEIEPALKFNGKISTDGKNYLYINANGGKLFINEIQLSGKKRMPVKDFLRGFSIKPAWNLQ